MKSKIFFRIYYRDKITRAIGNDGYGLRDVNGDVIFTRKIVPVAGEIHFNKRKVLPFYSDHIAYIPDMLCNVPIDNCKLYTCKKYDTFMAKLSELNFDKKVIKQLETIYNKEIK